MIDNNSSKLYACDNGHLIRYAAGVKKIQCSICGKEMYVVGKGIINKEYTND